MKVGRKEIDKKHWYEEISFGVTKVVKVSKSHGFVIPKHFIDRGLIQHGDSGILIFLKRTRDVYDALSKEEQIKMKQFMNMNEREIKAREAVLRELEKEAAN